MQEPEKSVTKPPHNNISVLYSLIDLLYTTLPPEHALQFWGAGPQTIIDQIIYSEYTESMASKLPSFLQGAVWSTQLCDKGMLMALYDMLTSLSNSQQCSELTYNFLARGGTEVIFQ